MPAPRKGEDLQHFIARFMASREAQRSFPNQKQRVAVAHAMFRKRKR